ncbi:MAG: hypothetical protein V2G42_08375 [bacterium JZ-2024 1]
MAKRETMSAEAIPVDRACALYLGESAWKRLRAIPQLFVVGGAIRDALLQRPILDLDLAATPSSAEMAQTILAQLSTSFVRINDRFSTVRFLFRHGVYADFSVAEHGIEEDLIRRDFTLNALALEVQTRVLKDLFGGFRDLKARRLVPVRPQNLTDDPVRVLRAYRLARECGLKIPRATRSAMVTASAYLQQVAPERISEEWRRIFRLKGSASDARAMFLDGVLFALFPQMQPMPHTPASPIYDTDVLAHTLSALDALEDIFDDPSREFHRFAEPISQFLARDDWQYLLRTALLFHDIAKPATANTVNGTLHYYGHDTLGARMTEDILCRLRFPGRDIQKIVTLIRAHLRIGFLSAEETLTPRQIYRYFHEFGDLGIPLIVHARADLLGYGPDMMSQPYGRNQPSVSEALLSAYFERNQILVRPPRHLSGDDLKALGIPPGPVYALILEAAQEATALGKITSRAQALEWARDFYSSLRLPPSETQNRTSMDPEES